MKRNKIRLSGVAKGYGICQMQPERRDDLALLRFQVPTGPRSVIWAAVASRVYHPALFAIENAGLKWRTLTQFLYGKVAIVP
jgi:hypothetical protein